ncbi:hypothetical protein [Undibacterium macrobrachii]|uniref:Uncharacterized protein n=1 Tax=Undibacterium macrobrachii TaxID=1119058 RepID=A0ABQ2XF46_9BURK|nr:hypothetical protein [Undibacterium macrobrachii]GGX13738.1 hypothetical protein GCM10011282_19830 [Undibacterium macrobrachii]
MTLIAVLIFVALLVAYAAFSLPIHFQFRSYCEYVANATARVKELHDQRSVDDGGNNAFERELWWRLLKKDYLDSIDPILVEKSEELSRKIRLSLIFAIGLVAAFPALIFIGSWVK